MCRRPVLMMVTLFRSCISRCNTASLVQFTRRLSG
ncbi:hypothetical protein MUK42_01767 [Musa troglodytarum]|uniref:Uncharacterized protein n=1 Tax=Musa troglodytarum TaxID=320322 RepID=A0A9E7G0P8_9LILI|nr:hypothetical protein MUK42_01767 [Musa troglodytarum]